MMELFKDTMLVLEQRLEDKFDECICGVQSMRSSIVSEVQALKLEVGHLSEVAFGEIKSSSLMAITRRRRARVVLLLYLVIQTLGVSLMMVMSSSQALLQTLLMDAIFVTLRDRRLVFGLRSLCHFGGFSSEEYVRFAVWNTCWMIAITMTEVILVVS
jgi:hypothetical protein